MTHKLQFRSVALQLGIMKCFRLFAWVAAASMWWLVIGCSTSPLAGSSTLFVAAIAQVQGNTKDLTSVFMAQDLGLQANQMSSAATLDESQFQPFVSATDLTTRVLALQGLLQYATAIKNLANTDSQSNFQSAADTLVSDLNATTNSIRTLFGANPTQVVGICDALSQLGENVVEAILAQKRNAALRKALEENQKSVEIVCGTFAGELDPGSGFEKKYGHGVFYHELERQFRSLETEIQKQFDAAVAAKDEKARQASASAYATLLEKKDYSLRFCRAVGGCYERLATVHTALAMQAKTGKSPQASFDDLNAQLQLTSLYLEQLKAMGGK